MRRVKLFENNTGTFSIVLAGKEKGIQKTVLIVVLCMLSFTGIKAQYNSQFLNYSQMGRSVSANVDFDAGSNGMSSRLVNKLVWGGYIDNDLKKASSKYLRAKNNFGINLNYDLSAFFKGNSKFDFLVSLKNQEIINATYSRDMFNLMFYGNQMYKGATADLSNCNVNALRFQEVKFGAMLHQVDSVGKIGVAVSFIKGEQLFFAKTGNSSSLYTSADGSEILFNSNFSLALSDTNNKRLGSFNGIGASADIFFETTYKSRLGRKSVLVVNANNIGFIHWQNQSVQYSSDSVFRYTGYNVNSIFDLKDSTIKRINGDSLVRKLSNARSEDFNVNIPTNLVIVNKIYFTEAFKLSAGFRFIFNANYKPYIFLEPEYRYKNVTFALHTGYGGYVRLNVGTSVTWNSRGWFLKIGSNSLQGYVLPKTAFGQSLFISLAKKL